MHPLGETPSTTITLSFVKHPNHRYYCMGWKVVENEQYIVDMLAVIILTPWTDCRCAR